jgi:hypothetical protein
MVVGASAALVAGVGTQVATTILPRRCAARKMRSYSMPLDFMSAG